QERGLLDRGLPRRVPAPDLRESWGVIVVDGDEEALGVEAVHFDKTVIVGDGSVDNEENEVVVVVELRALPELLRVLNGERVELEDLAEDLEVLMLRLIKIEPEESLACQQLLDRLPAELHLFRALVLEDMAHRPPRLIGRRARLS